MPIDGSSSPTTNVVDDDCHSTNDNDNNTNVLDNSDKAELSTVDESVNNDDEVRLGRNDVESTTNDGNDGDTPYQDVTTVDDSVNNDAGVEQQRVGGQDEDNSNVRTNNVGDESLQVAKSSHGAETSGGARTTSTSSDTSIIDDESTQSSSQTVTEGNDQVIPLEQADTNQLMNLMSNMIQNNTDDTARLAEIMGILLLRFNRLSRESAEMSKVVQQQLQSPDFEEVLARLKAVENENAKLKKQTKKHSKAIRNGQKDHASLRAEFNTLREEVMRHRVSKEQVREE